MFACIYMPARADSAAPPTMVVLVESAPADLQLAIRIKDTLLKKDTVIRFSSFRTAWETRFSLDDYFNVSNSNSVTLVVSSSEKSFECPLSTNMFRHYENYYTLNMKNQTLTDGQTIGRITSLVLLRVICTLLIEGGIFFLFGFRQRRSWIAFLIINLLTQIGLNTVLSLNTFSNGYVFLTLIFLEVIIFFVEAIAFLLALKEHSIGRRLLYVLIANIASFILGGYLISILPI